MAQLFYYPGEVWYGFERTKDFFGTGKQDSLICELRSIIQKYEDSINLSVMGFPENYDQVLTDNK